MSRIKEFYHEEICREMFEDIEQITREEAVAAFEKEGEIAAEDAQILKRADEMAHSEMPNFLF